MRFRRSLDTKIDKFDLCHVSMFYASYFIILHIMSYDANDISQFGLSWCRNDCLKVRNHTNRPILAEKLFKNKKGLVIFSPL